MKTFIDTSPFIYLIENKPAYADIIKSYFLEALTNDHEIITSVISVMEFGVVPEKKGKHELIIQFEAFLQTMNITVEIIDKSIAETASKLRARYNFLKGMDALQVAVAIEKGCDYFLTNDKKLVNISEVQILLVENMKPI